MQTLLHVLPVSRCDKWWYLYRRGSVSYAGSVSSQSECRPPSNRLATMLVPQTDPFPRCRQVGLIFILGGAPKAHEVSYVVSARPLARGLSRRIISTIRSAAW